MVATKTTQIVTGTAYFAIIKIGKRSYPAKGSNYSNPEYKVYEVLFTKNLKSNA